MDARKLPHFLAVAEELSFSKAARRCRMSQPALSRSIKELEREIGAELFIRNTGRVALTEIGSLILPKVDEAVLLIDETLQEIRTFAAGKKESLHIGYLPFLYNAFMGEALETFRQTAPSVALYPMEMTPTEQRQALSTGELDICLTKLFDNESMDPNFDYFDLFTVNMCAAVSVNDPLAKHDTLSIHDFKDRALIGYSAKEFPECDIEFSQVFKEHGLKYNPLSRANSIRSALATLEAGKSFALMPDMKTEKMPRDTRAIKLSPNVSTMKFYGAVLRDEKRKSVLSFLQECRRIGNTKYDSAQTKYLVLA